MRVFTVFITNDDIEFSEVSFYKKPTKISESIKVSYSREVTVATFNKYIMGRGDDDQFSN